MGGKKDEIQTPLVAILFWMIQKSRSFRNV